MSTPTLTTEAEVRGPWSLATSREFWEGFAPARLSDRPERGVLQTTFLVDQGWSRCVTRVEQVDRDGATYARINVSGPGDLAAATSQVQRFLSLDVDARGWPEVGERDPVIGGLQRELPGLRPCGFHSPYEAAAWAVLSQRIRIVQAAALRGKIVDRYGDDGAFPTPEGLLALDLDLPGRKVEYLHAVAEAALDGVLDGARLRAMDPAAALESVRQIKGIGPFAADLIVVRGANAPDVLPQNEQRLTDEIAHRYGAEADPIAVAAAWRPFRTWASVLLRSAREARTGEIAGAGRR